MTTEALVPFREGIVDSAIQAWKGSCLGNEKLKGNEQSSRMRFGGKQIVTSRKDGGRNNLSDFAPHLLHRFTVIFTDSASATLQIAPDACLVGTMFTVTHDYEAANGNNLGNAVSAAGATG